MRIAQVLRRHVHRDGERLAVALPYRGLQDRLAQHPQREVAREAGALERRDELRRRQDAARRMAPAHQRFDRDERAVARRHDRLVMEHQLVLDDRLLQLEANVEGHASVLCASSHSVADAVGGVRPRRR